MLIRARFKTYYLWGFMSIFFHANFAFGIKSPVNPEPSESPWYPFTCQAPYEFANKRGPWTPFFLCLNYLNYVKNRHD